jgi:hypothetical protein
MSRLWARETRSPTQGSRSRPEGDKEDIEGRGRAAQMTSLLTYRFLTLISAGVDVYGYRDQEIIVTR